MKVLEMLVTQSTPNNIALAKGLCMNYIVTDEGGGCLQIITVLLKVEGGSSRMITVLHRGGPAKEWFT